MKRIYLLGSLNCDLSVRAPYLPEAGETLAGSDFMISAGGKGANQAYACARLGGSVVMAGAVGNDSFGDLVLSGLKGAGADVSCVRKTARNTGVAVITIIDGDNRIVLDEGANAEVTEEDVQKLLKAATAGDIFMTQLENPLPVVRYALQYAQQKGLFTVFNPAPAKAEARGCVPFSNLITPNRKELKLLSGKEGLDEGCEELLRLGAKQVIVTLGSEGSYLYGRETKEKVGCFCAGEAIDTTAAGDTFCGATCVKLAEGAPLKTAMEFAAVCSGIAVTRRGAQISVPTRAEAETLFGK